MSQENDLAQELTTYDSHRSHLLAESEGKYVLIHQEEVAGVWDTYKDALQEGYNRYGLEPFLVRRIESSNAIHNFTRFVQPCQS